MKTSISYFDTKKNEYVKVLGSFNYPNSKNRNFDNWLYSRKLDYGLGNPFLKEGVTTSHLIRACQKSATDASGVVNLENITSLFAKSFRKDDRAKQVMFHFLGMFQVDEIFTFSKDEYVAFIRGAYHPSFVQPATYQKMLKEVESLPVNSRIISTLGYQPEVAKEVQNADDIQQYAFTYKKVI